MGKNGFNKKYYKYIIIILVAVFLISAVLFVMALWERQQGTFPSSAVEEPVINYNGKTYTLKSDVETFLVIGLDKYEEESGSSETFNNNKQADFLLLFVLDNASKKCSAIQINRDTMVNVNVLGVAGNRIDTVVKQIALAHTYGNGKDVSCRNVADSVSSLLLGMRVTHYASVLLDAVPILNDAVGGVEVLVTDDFSGVDETIKKGETVTLTGEHALIYVRAREGMSEPTNVARMGRQKQYLNALYKKLQAAAATDADFIADTAVRVSDYLVSDRSVTQLQDLAKKITDYEFKGIITLEGESKVGEKYMEFHPNDDFLKATVIDLFYELKD